ncbi:hypothetical protein [Mucilaginibacter kameinonensis]|uniref:hypothetical protein n=1 Tax=Mucilaginibacter kameinonensis TaxID=452286 RepID=UPI000EF79D6D|nr:hypothetical protein [Mucilaginibacter kameinonensis]
MKPKYLLISLLILFPFILQAQSNFKPGYVITINGQTIQGFINEKEWDTNPAIITFKTALSGAEVKNYTPNNISYFEITNSVAYQRYSGFISTDETNTAKLSTGRDSSKKQDVVFLKLQQKGPNVSLYSYNDAIKMRYFITDNKAGKTAELIFRQYFLPEMSTTTHSENEYVPQLYDLAAKYNPGSAELKRLIENARYSLSDLKKVSQQINNLSVDNTHYGTSPSIDFFVGAGADATTYTYSGAAPFLYSIPNKTSVAPFITAGLNFYPNYDAGRFAFRAEILYTSSSYESQVDLYYAQPEKPKGTYRLKQHEIGLGPEVLYFIYNTKDLKVYLGAGLLINLASYSGNTTTNNADASQVMVNVIQLDKRWLSYPVKAGLLINKKLEVALSYAFPSSITDIASNSPYKYALKVSSIKGGLNYHF